MQGSQPVWYTPSNPAASADSFLTRFYTLSYTDWLHFRLLLFPFHFCPDWRNEVDLIETVRR